MTLHQAPPPDPDPAPRFALAAPLTPQITRELVDERLRRAGVRLLLKRDDLIDPGVPGSGTKWRKLLPNARAARSAGHDTLLTFGGAYSHHLRATAAAGRRFGLRTVGVVRGEELRDRPLNPGLARAAAYGMRLDFMDRVTWRLRDTPRVLEELHERHGPAYVLPEGGSNALGVRGCRTVTEELNSQAPEVDVICCSVGTGGMLAGLAAGLRPGQRALGFAALKPGPSLDLDAETAALQRLAFGARRGSWYIDHRYHFGGYGRSTPELKAFAAGVADRQDGEAALDLDLTYEAKALYGLLDLVERGAFRRGTTLALIIAG
jgi:1-aminocyclopropane-1-carboxylate deaminase/D-cysteine desulfhydrase-like pyridoxal-dependent ACC family enzyme